MRLLSRFAPKLSLRHTRGAFHRTPFATSRKRRVHGTLSLGIHPKSCNYTRLVVRLRLLVGIRFQVSFTPLVGVLFTFPSLYWFTIGRLGVLRLGAWSPHVQTGFHVSRLTRESRLDYAYGAITRYGPTFQMVPLVWPRLLAWSAFARHY